VYDSAPTDCTVVHWPQPFTYGIASFYLQGTTKGRYRPIFHWNERIAQLQMSDPVLPQKIQNKIIDAVLTGKYGPPDDFTRATVVTILRDLYLNCYRERWKSILAGLNPNFKPEIVSRELLQKAENLHKRILYEFKIFKDGMPKSTIRTNGKCVVKDRHNVLPFNYEFRKIMEVFDVYDYHAELPLLRSTQKLKALDDITEKIFARLGLPFIRTAIIKRPKIRRCRKKATPQTAPL
jgi:hypothetical protein